VHVSLGWICNAHGIHDPAGDLERIHFRLTRLIHEEDLLNFVRGLIWAASVIICTSGIAAGETYPDRPVRIIVPFAPAGPGDVMARLLAQKLSEDLGKQFYIENQPGAGGNIGQRGARRPRRLHHSGHVIGAGGQSESL
jgi:hypothetical protein